VGLNWKFHGFLHSETSCFLHTGCCRLPPPAPVASMLDSSAATLWILLSYWFTCVCMLSSVANERHHLLDDVGLCFAPCSASGAASLSCACCQASPAAPAVSPSPGVPLSSLDQLIWSKTDGDVNFQSVALIALCSSMLFDPSARRPKCEVDSKQLTIENSALNTFCTWLRLFRN